jgi:hypothetical protein
MINNWVRFNESVEKTDITLEHIMKILYCRNFCNDDDLLDILEDKLTDILSDIHEISLTDTRRVLDLKNKKIVLAYANRILNLANTSNQVMTDLHDCYQICFDFVDWINFEETETVLLDFEDLDYRYEFEIEEKLLIIKLYKEVTSSPIDFTNEVKLAKRKLPRLSKIQSGDCKASLTKFNFQDGEIEIFVEKK